MLVVFETPGSEHFRVRLFYTHAFTTTIVEPLEKFTEHPSVLVIVVRKCLEEYFSKVPNPDVVFQSLGPSPFHADFFASSEAGNVGEVRCVITNQPGYDKITYNVLRTEVAESNEVYNLVLKHVTEELSGFY